MVIVVDRMNIDFFQSCVKLNNIESARNLLDQIYNTMQADRISATLLEHAPPVPDKVERERFLFTVKIVMAENLVPLDSSPSSKLDSYVKITDQNAVTLGKTRTIYESNDPQCMCMSFICNFYT